MPSRRRALFVLIGAIPLAAPACGGDSGLQFSQDNSLVLQEVVRGLSFPLFLASPPGDTARLFVAEKSGAIRIIANGALLPTPFLNLAGQISTGGEQGLLGFAFHPQYQTNGRVVVSFTMPSGDSRIAEYRVSADPNVADPGSGQVILDVAQPFSNHNGGMVAFGPDGFLYVGLGDGGSGGDPRGHGQSTDDLLGSLLRLDLDGSAPYAIPPSNPFVGQAAARGELWNIGLRNPWRFSFDRLTGDLYIADVGQNDREEINFQPAASTGGENYGWNILEGSRCFTGANCDRGAFTGPMTDYVHAGGACSVTGGYVYRGVRLPAVRGTYFYADFCSGWVRSLRWDGRRAVQPTEWPGLAPGGQIASFGQDDRGELYLLTADGRVLRIVAR